MRTQGWQIAVAIGLGMGGAIGLSILPTNAQSVIVPDETLGAERSLVVPNYNGLPVEAIGGGAQRGQNLFHSFSQFNVSAGRGAYFAIQNDVVRNVLTRVTGGSRSEIFGTLGTFRPIDGSVRLPGVNLFLINPNGIVFGENASLDVGGSFFATTANAVQLGATGLFSASQPASSNLLTVDPSAFWFNAIASQNLPEIVVRSQATTSLFGDPTFGLQVRNRQTLLLLGGNVTVDGGWLSAYGGQVEIGSVNDSGIVGLNTNSSLQIPDGMRRADVIFNNRTQVDVSLDKGGDIGITARNITVSGNSELIAGISDGFGALGSQAGDVTLNTTGAIRIAGQSSRIRNDVNSNAIGKGGNLAVIAESLVITGGAQLSTSTFGQGDAGNTSIQAQSISIDGGVNNFRSGIFNNVQDSGVGKGGTIDIQTNTLSFTRGGQITSATFGQGDAGNTSIQAQSISIDGGVNNFRSGILNNVEGSGVGKGGTIDIQTNTLSFTSGGQITSATFGQGDAGNTRIKAQAISIDGGVNFRSGIFNNVESGGVGKGGAIDIHTNTLSFTNGGRITSATVGQGDAGNVSIRAKGVVQLNDGTIETRSLYSSGGDIQISAAQIRLFGNSDIRTFVESGSGKGGDITLTAGSIIAFNDSDILTFSTGGRGGNITFNSPAFFGQNYRPAPFGTDPRTLDGNNRVDVNASGTVSGIITIPDTTFIQNSLTQLAQNLIDPNTLLANSCIVRSSKQNGRFYITGSGGLPVRPGDAPLSSFPTGEVRAVGEKREQGEQGMQGMQRENNIIQNSAVNTQNSPDRPWKIGDPIVEPQGIYRLSNGKLVLSRECEQ